MATAAELQVRDRVFIGGEWVAPSGNEPIEVINATTEEAMGTVPACSSEDADRAVAAAREAFTAWSQTSREERAGYHVGDRRRPRRARRRDRRDDLPGAGDAAEAEPDDPGRPADRPVRGDAEAAGGDRLGGGDRQLAGAARAGRRGRRDHPLELPAEPDRLQGRPRPRGRLHRRPQAQRGDAAERLHPRRGDRGRRPARPASSTSSPAPGRSSARRSPPTPASTWSPSPAPPGPASGSASSPRRQSSRWRWSSAASRRT